MQLLLMIILKGVHAKNCNKEVCHVSLCWSCDCTWNVNDLHSFNQQSIRFRYLHVAKNVRAFLWYLKEGILIGYFMAWTCISLIFSPETLYFPRPKGFRKNAGSRVKISGKYMFKPCYNLFIPCLPAILFKKKLYNAQNQNV